MWISSWHWALRYPTATEFCKKDADAFNGQLGLPGIQRHTQDTLGPAINRRNFVPRPPREGDGVLKKFAPNPFFFFSTPAVALSG